MKLLLCSIPRSDANAFARLLVTDLGAACVSVNDSVTSVYRWQDELCEEPESLLMIKVASAKAAALREALVKQHPYDLPEVLSLALDEAGSYAPYMDWVEQS